MAVLAVFAFRQGQLALRLAGHPAVTSPPHVLILPSPPRVDQRHPKARFSPISHLHLHGRRPCPHPSPSPVLHVYDSHQTARGLWLYKRQFGFGGLAGGWPGAGAVRRGFQARRWFYLHRQLHHSRVRFLLLFTGHSTSCATSPTHSTVIARWDVCWAPRRWRQVSSSSD